MVIDNTGQNKYPIARKKSGQVVYEFEDYHLFILENYVYRTAGNQHWPNAVENGDIGRKGVSLNKKLFGKAVSSNKKPFNVYDQKTDTLYELVDREMVANVLGRERRKGRTLVVLPLDAFEEKDPGTVVPEELRR